ncbi:septum site-determining protein MinC [Pseudoneobacillus sp. C159]
MKKTQNVMIKGSKDGLTLHLDDSCSYHELKKELDDKLSATYRAQGDRPLITVKVSVGNRYLTEEQKEEIKSIVRQKKNMVVDTIESNVMTIEEAKQIKTQSDIVTVSKIVRSGQILQVEGDLLLVGDVNPGGTVIAGGNIFIMGSLRGIAHAGCDGDESAVIVASYMNPAQLRISGLINRAPETLTEEVGREMECAYIDENNHIVVDRLQVLMRIRPNFTRFEGGR